MEARDILTRAGLPAPRGARLSAVVTGWTNVALGVLTGIAAAAGYLSGTLSGAEIPFFFLVASLLAAAGVFAVALRASPVFIFGTALLLLGLFLGFGLLVGGAIVGTGGTGLATAVGVSGCLLAALEFWMILSVWRARRHARAERSGGQTSGAETGREAAPHREGGGPDVTVSG